MGRHTSSAVNDVGPYGSRPRDGECAAANSSSMRDESRGEKLDQSDTQQELDEPRAMQQACSMRQSHRERWADAPEDFQVVEIPADELRAILLAVRPCLPHQQSSKAEFLRMTPPHTFSDALEPVDAVVRDGLRLGSMKGGRGPLPRRLGSGRPSRGGALDSGDRRPSSHAHCCGPNLHSPVE